MPRILKLRRAMGKNKASKSGEKENKNISAGISLLFLALVLLLSFVNINDRNLLGPFGVVIERITYFVLGRAAYVLPFIVLLYGLNILRKNNKYNDAKAALGFTLLTLSIAVFLSLTSNNFDPKILKLKFETFPVKQIGVFYATKSLEAFWKNVPQVFRVMGKYDFYKGGVVGTYSAKFLINWFSIVGAHIINAVFFVTGVILVNKEDFLLAFFKFIANVFVKIFQGAGYAIGMIFGAVGGAFGALSTAGKERRVQKASPAAKQRNGTKENEDREEDDEKEEERERPK